VQVGHLRRARMAMDGADFGMVEDVDVALAALQRLHPLFGTPHPDCDLSDPLPLPARPPLTYHDDRDSLQLWEDSMLLVLRKVPRLSAPSC
jgi:hypothetical protein